LNQYISNKVTREQLEYMLQIVHGSLAKRHVIFSNEEGQENGGVLTQDEAHELIIAIVNKLKLVV
jgi:hypothetical protein